MMDELFGFLD